MIYTFIIMFNIFLFYHDNVFKDALKSNEVIDIWRVESKYFGLFF